MNGSSRNEEFNTPLFDLPKFSYDKFLVTEKGLIIILGSEESFKVKNLGSITECIRKWTLIFDKWHTYSDTYVKEAKRPTSYSRE